MILSASSSKTFRLVCLLIGSLSIFLGLTTTSALPADSNLSIKIAKSNFSSLSKTTTKKNQRTTATLVVPAVTGGDAIVTTQHNQRTILSSSILQQCRPKSRLQEQDGENSCSTLTNDIHSILKVPRGGGDITNRKGQVMTTTTTRERGIMSKWFKRNATKREKILATWLLFWNTLSLIDSIMFALRSKERLQAYTSSYDATTSSNIEIWCPRTLAMTRHMLGSSQFTSIALVTVLALTGNEFTIKTTFKVLILSTFSAFHAVAIGVQQKDGYPTLKAAGPWQSQYVLMSLPPTLFLSYFAFIF